jgi:triacylglycerol lipase
MTRGRAAHAARARLVRCAALLVALSPGLGSRVVQAAGDEPVDPAARPPVVNDCVILLHGLGRTHRSMDRIESALRGAGFTTANINYPSQSHPIETLAVTAVPEGLRRCRSNGAKTIHFVTHSMGGLVLRYYLSSRPVEELGRVVMLSPPNQGSEIADAMVGNSLYDRVNGPAGAQLVTGPAGIAARLGPANFPVGIISGTEQTAFDSIMASRIPGPNDGKVAVERAKLEGMSDFMVLPVNHTFMVNDEVVLAQTLHFLFYGAFLHEAPDPAD